MRAPQSRVPLYVSVLVSTFPPCWHFIMPPFLLALTYPCAFVHRSRDLRPAPTWFLKGQMAGTFTQALAYCRRLFEMEGAFRHDISLLDIQGASPKRKAASLSLRRSERKRRWSRGWGWSEHCAPLFAGRGSCCNVHESRASLCIPAAAGTCPC